MYDWFVRYYGDTQTMKDSFNATYAYIQLLDTNPAGINHGLGDWMPVEGTSTAFTGPGFLRMSYLAFANITDILGMHDLAAKYRGKVTGIDSALNSMFLNNATGAYAAASVEKKSHSKRHVPVTGRACTPTPFCAEGGLNPKPNPGDESYQQITLRCDQPGDTIAAIQFAQWGMPTGGPTCSTWKAGDPCGKEGVTEAWARKACIGKATCVLDPRPALGDTCPNQHKTFAVQAICKACNGMATVQRGSGSAPAPPGPPVPHGQATSQTGQGMALFMGIVPEQLRAKALAQMAANANAATHISPDGGPGPHMTAGLFGIKWFLMSLADGGMNDLAYDVLTTPTYPGFKYMMNNQHANATTIWESWFFSDNTFSHAPFDCVSFPLTAISSTVSFPLTAIVRRCLSL